MKIPTCTICYEPYHTSINCWRKAKMPIKAGKQPTQYGKRAQSLAKWIKEVARPYLDNTAGHKCVECGATGSLDVDHIKNKGSHPELKRDLNNLQYLCRDCHIKKTNKVLDIIKRQA